MDDFQAVNRNDAAIEAREPRCSSWDSTLAVSWESFVLSVDVVWKSMWLGVRQEPLPRARNT